MQEFISRALAAAFGAAASASLGIGAAAAADVAPPPAEVQPPPAYAAPPPAVYAYPPPPVYYGYGAYYGYAAPPALVVPAYDGPWWRGPYQVRPFGVYARGWGRGYRRW